MSEPNQINILIADDHAMFRDTLELYLMRAHPTFKCYMASDLHEVVDVLNRGSFVPDLCIIDFKMPGMKGVESINELIKSYPQQHFAVMSGIAGQSEAEKIINTDISGFLPKTLSGRHFLNAIETMLEGEKFIPFETDRSVKMCFLHDRGKLKLEIDLTSRERQVLALLCEGKSNREIAEILSLKIVTIKLHIRGLFQKFGCSNRTQVVLKAKEWRVLE